MWLIDKAEDVVLGNYKEGTFEQRLTIIGCFTVGLVSLIATLLDFIWELYSIGFLTAILSIVSILCFSAARFGFFHRWLIRVIFVIAIVFYNLSWYFNFGSQGPTFLLIIGIYVFFALIWKHRNSFLLVGFSLGNLLLLYLFEYLSPDITGHYPSESTRIANVYAVGIFTLLTTFVLTFSIKRNYIRQYENAKKSDQLKAAFLANLSHEVRTPLNVISGFISMIPEMELGQDELKKIHRIIDLNGKQLLHLIEDTIDLSKLELGQLELCDAPVDLAKVFDELKQDFENKLFDETPGVIKLSSKLQVNDLQVIADEFRLKQVLRSLISNSYHFSDRGSILYGCYEEQNRLVFYVKDTGRGIKPENVQHIFEPFVKFQNRDHTIERGVGIGLNLSKRLVELMGGRIWVNTTYLKGSEFYFSIPKKQMTAIDFH